MSFPTHATASRLRPVGAPLEATSIGSVALGRLSARKGVVHSVFDGAVNILFPGGLVSLVPESAGRGPLNITLRVPDGAPRMSSLVPKVGAEMTMQGLRLEAYGGADILLGSAEIYSPPHRLSLPLLKSDLFLANSEAMRRTAVESGKMAGLGGLLALLTPRLVGTTNGNLNIFALAARKRIVRLEQAFMGEDRDALAHAVRELIGLGPGLTPSSDDLLAGLILLSVLYGANGGSRRPGRLISEAVGTSARGRTTLLSEEFLLQAGSGNGNEPVTKLCTTLLTGGRDAVEQETEHVLAIGETSGTDTVLGIILGARLCIHLPSGLAGRGL